MVTTLYTSTQHSLLCLDGLYAYQFSSGLGIRDLRKSQQVHRLEESIEDGHGGVLSLRFQKALAKCWRLKVMS